MREVTHAQIIQSLTKRDFRLCAVNLVDSHYCSDAAKYMSVLLVTLTTMLKLGLPHVNVLSKMDLLPSYGELDFSIEYFTEVMDLGYLCDRLDASMAAGPRRGGAGRGDKYVRLNRAVAELVEDFNLVGFVTLAVEDKDSMMGVLRLVDKANGYCFGDRPLAVGSYAMTADASGRQRDPTARFDQRHGAATATAADFAGIEGLEVRERHASTSAPTPMERGFAAANGVAAAAEAEGSATGGRAPAADDGKLRFGLPQHRTRNAEAIMRAAREMGQRPIEED
jgi:hypothetical protein